jgi:hypothetical protein
VICTEEPKQVSPDLDEIGKTLSGIRLLFRFALLLAESNAFDLQNCS